MATTQVSDTQKAIARHLAAVFGGEPEVRRHWSEDRSRYVAVLGCENRPQTGVTSWGTIGLSEFALHFDDGSPARTRVELVGACESAYVDFEETLLAACTSICARGELPQPGTILLDTVAALPRERSEMQHLFLVPPFIWGDRSFTPIELGGRTVSWLQAVPISQAEAAFAEAQGPEALDDLLEERAVDVYDIFRESVL